jgi:hypothetical protein
MQRLQQLIWLAYAYLLETFVLDPLHLKLTLLHQKHSTEMDDIKQQHAFELERTEADFQYDLAMMRSRMNLLWRRIEAIREFNGGDVTYEVGPLPPYHPMCRSVVEPRFDEEETIA